MVRGEGWLTDQRSDGLSVTSAPSGDLRKIDCGLMADRGHGKSKLPAIWAFLCSSPGPVGRETLCSATSRAVGRTCTNSYMRYCISILSRKGLIRRLDREGWSVVPGRFPWEGDPDGGGDAPG
jgi:hypothetical protein